MNFLHIGPYSIDCSELPSVAHKARLVTYSLKVSLHNDRPRPGQPLSHDEGCAT